MGENTAEIAIIGAGPGGSHLASILAAQGIHVALFDPKGAWEKPCGGGVTSRCLKEFPFLLEQPAYPSKGIRKITIVSPSKRSITLSVERPFAVFSRQVFNGLILDRAIEAGAQFIKESITDFTKEDGNWLLTAGDGSKWRADFLVGSDGAASFTRRRLLGIFGVRDLALAFGYNVENADGASGAAPVPDEEVLVVFPKNFTGYLWAFPRPGVMNFGVASKLGERTSDELRQVLKDFMRDYYKGRMPDSERMTFFGAKIPTLDLATWSDLKASGEGWALIGDAAGFADPITGEGIYYALKSAELLATALLGERAKPRSTRDGRELEGFDGESVKCYTSASKVYDKLWRQHFGRELEHASYRLPQFYHGYFFGHLITDAMVRLAQYHRGVRKVLLRALMGEQSYITLKRDLLLRAFQIF